MTASKTELVTFAFNNSPRGIVDAAQGAGRLGRKKGITCFMFCPIFYQNETLRYIGSPMSSRFDKIFSDFSDSYKGLTAPPEFIVDGTSAKFQDINVQAKEFVAVLVDKKGK